MILPPLCVAFFYTFRNHINRVFIQSCPSFFGKISDAIFKLAQEHNSTRRAKSLSQNFISFDPDCVRVPYHNKSEPGRQPDYRWRRHLRQRRMRRGLRGLWNAAAARGIGDDAAQEQEVREPELIET